ncbi:hypothetical protein C0J52_07190 [Blattella germanica]|nr:hypothetical protein C0J52_07190 [Blattella germanica]
MGNVMAASQAPGGGLSPPGSMPPPPPPTVGIPPGFAKPEGLDTKTQGSSDQQRNGLENPGSMEDLHKKCKGVLVSHYLQSVTPSVALGAELAYQYGPNVPGCEIAVLSAAARYTGKDNVVSGTIGGSGLHLCYYQKASEQLQIGVELETNFRVQESVATIGYQVDLPKADLCFRGKQQSCSRFYVLNFAEYGLTGRFLKCRQGFHALCGSACRGYPPE